MLEITENAKKLPKVPKISEKVHHNGKCKKSQKLPKNQQAENHQICWKCQILPKNANNCGFYCGNICGISSAALTLQ